MEKAKKHFFVKHPKLAYIKHYNYKASTVTEQSAIRVRLIIL